MANTYSTVVQVPPNISSITLDDGAHVPVNNQIVDASDASATTLCTPPNACKVIVPAQLGSTTTVVSLPANVSSITVSGTAYTPDGSQYNVISVPEVDATILCQFGFQLVSSAANS